jgi:hypothetical protein
MNRHHRRALAAQGQLSVRDQVIDPQRHLEEIETDHMSLPRDDRFYFPAFDMNNGLVTLASWLKQLNVSLPNVDLVSLGEQLGEAPRMDKPPRDIVFELRGIVRVKELVALLDNRTTWRCDRAFIRRRISPPKTGYRLIASTCARCKAWGCASKTAMSGRRRHREQETRRQERVSLLPPEDPMGPSIERWPV